MKTGIGINQGESSTLDQRTPEQFEALQAAAPDLLAELRDRSQALGGVKILLLQNDLTGAMEILDRYELVFTDGPIMVSPAIGKAEPQGSQS